MEILLGLFFLWVFVTLVGHGSWVVIRTLLKVVSDQPASPAAAKYSRRDDLAAGRRVIQRLVDAQAIDSEQALELLHHLRDLEYSLTPAARTSDRPVGAAGQVEPRRPAQPLVGEERSSHAAAADQPPVLAKLCEDVDADQKVWDAEVVDEDVQAVSPPVAPPSSGGLDPLPGTAARSAPAAAQPASPDAMPSPVGMTSAVATPRTVATANAPVLSRAEIIQSFLAAHNIRWGELVAGMLIVICSIGLVISLWQTIVEYRVIPSLIFLGANAAIYAAGLYTLSRWKLRHTSRAVLVIATLLVPLSVLAGLAAAGTGVDAVRLNDPVTLLSLAVAGVIYGALLLLGGKALTGPYARQVALAVAGPAIVLPLIPAAIRTFGAGAGWCVAIGSAAIVVSVTWMLKVRQRPTRLGVVGSRTRLLAMAFGGFALAVTIGYVLLAVSEFEPQQLAILPIAISSIPGWIGLAGAGRSLMTSARSGTQSLIGAVTCVLLVGLSWAILPAAMVGADWLWGWAIALSISGLAIGWILNQPRWLPVSTLPVGIATIVSSHVWMTGAAWDSVPIWNRIIGGQPMIAATLVAVIVCLATVLIGNRQRRLWMGYAAMFWIGFAIISAGVLAVGPESLLGIARWWLVTAILAGCVIASVYFACRDSRWSWSTIVATTLAYASCFRPLQLFQSDPVQTPDVWMFAALAVAGTLMVLREAAPRIKPLANSAMSASSVIWGNASVVTCGLAALIACLSARGDWSTSSVVLAMAAALIFWAATASRSILTLQVAQLVSLAAAIVMVHGQLADRLFAGAAWQAGQACWTWAIMTATVTALWFLVREMARLPGPLIRRRLRFVHQRRARSSEMVDGWTTMATVTFVAWGACWAFAALPIGVAGGDWLVNDTGLIVPLVAIAAGCGIVVWMRRQQTGTLDRMPDTLATILLLATTVWASSYLAAELMQIDAMGRFVVGSTLAIAGCLAWASVGRAANHRFDFKFNVESAISVAVLVLVVSSTVLLKYGWLDPIIDGKLAWATPTMSVAGWWLMASAGLLYGAKRSGNPLLAVGSACFAPAAIAILVPALRLVHPVVWLQWAALGSLAWATIARQWFRGDDWPVVRPTVLPAMLWATAFGIVTTTLVSLRILLDWEPLDVVCGIAGLALSVVAVALWVFGRLPTASGAVGGRAAATRLIWPIGLTLLAGQVAWLLQRSGLIAAEGVGGGEPFFSQLVHLGAAEILLTIWCVATLASLVRYRMRAEEDDFWHAGTVGVALMVLAIVMGAYGSTWMPRVGLVATVCCGLLTGFVANDSAASKFRCYAGRLLGWLTIGLGLGVIDQLGSGHPWSFKWTVLVTWIASWVVGWRLLSVDRRERWGIAAKAIPDVEFALLLALAAVSEGLFLIVSERAQVVGMIDGLFAVRMLAYWLVGLSTCFRAGRRLVWSQAIGTMVAVASLCAIRVGIAYDATVSQRAMLAAITSGFAVALLAHLLPWLARAVNLTRLAISDSVTVSVGRLVRALIHVAAVVSAAAVVLAASMIANSVSASIIQLTILSVALVAWAIAELAELSRSTSLRHASVTLALLTIGLFASVEAGETIHPWLSGSMRWLVASVFTTAMLLFAVPRLLGQQVLARWQPALGRGSLVSAAAAIGSLVVMLAVETAVRNADGIAGISRPLVIGVAVTLAILSLIAAVVAILSGSTKSPLGGIALSDSKRRGLIVAAQAIAAITWLHLFLCKTDWAFIGLRSYWPYIVMAIAFGSVGVTEWARRRGDRILSETLSQTSLYLPLVPVVGFWLSGAWNELSWAYIGGKVRYDLLLAMGAIYYVGLSAMWKHVWPRIAAIVLGNAALWVVLIQLPDWSFLQHPQAWLIPPALCVLAVPHLYRQRLSPAVVAGIRYASTLVIYVSSTADMLLQQIGQSIAGPIVLVLLALAGMLAGVLLRVRAFLYLGATFVFIGVTSMVWHAQVSIDAVWPWWVFGITTGILLLAGLMALEKNKDKLRHYAHTLGTWQG